MPRKKIPLSQIRPGPIRHVTLPSELIKRVMAYKKILGDADPAPVERSIENFKRDLNPEKEVAIWERIAHVFRTFTIEHNITDAARRRHVLRALLMISMGDDVPASDMLTQEQAAELNNSF